MEAAQKVQVRPRNLLLYVNELRQNYKPIRGKGIQDRGWVNRMIDVSPKLSQEERDALNGLLETVKEKHGLK